MKQLLAGANYLWRGVQLIREPGLRRYVLLPLAVNCALFGVMTVVLFDRLGLLVEWLVGTMPGWLDWLRYFVWPLLAGTALILFFYCFILVANLLAAPFNGLLAAAVERHLTGTSAGQSPNQPGLLKDAFYSVLSELHKWGYFILLALPVGVLLLIPVFNLVAPVIWILFSAWMLALEYADYPLGNQGMKFSEQRVVLRKKRLLTLGFGGATLLLTIIPLLNFIAMPAAVAGATAMWLDNFQGSHSDAP